MDLVDRYLSQRLDDALLSFSSQPKVWADPVLCKSPEFVRDAKSEDKIAVSDIILDPKSTIIKAPPLFGLTCLALHLAREAWRAKDSSLWLYLDSKSLKPHAPAIEKAAKAELKLLGCDKEDIKCILLDLDSLTSDEKDSSKLVGKVCNLFRDVPVIVMQTTDDTRLMDRSIEESADREFNMLYLWALPREQVRKVVNDYNDKKHIGDNDSVTTKIVSDLEVLNLHRTPLNCLTLLKVSEIDFDESPVNRTELINRILFLLFNVDDIPTYKARPDVKDCEYVLGYFCEKMLRENIYYFTIEDFVSVLRSFCQEKIMDLEVQVVFDVLYANCILIKRGSQFCFKYTYWIYYFAAQRMHQDENFANFIYEDMRYAKYPEIIEFYTGIDRRREGALIILIEDIRASCDKVSKKCGLPDGLNPYRFAQWDPSPDAIEQMQREIREGVLGSNLPDSVKDRYADRLYDRTRPYYQDIRDILSEHSFVFMIRSMRAGARALRNSDYVDPDTKRLLLKEILRCWEQILKVLLVLLPVLSEKGHAKYDGTIFVTYGSFGDTPEKRFLSILTQLPDNIVSWYKDDLFSQKMGPLLIEQLVNEDYDLKKHKLILLLIKKRPRGWKLHVQKYIASNKKNSFYLYDVYQSLRDQYRYSYASSHSLRDIEYLIKMVAAKQQFGSKKPGVKLIKKISNSLLPDRDVD